ncbi:hypothetical protein Tco_0713853 [Tanacetum coccineum]
MTTSMQLQQLTDSQMALYNIMVSRFMGVVPQYAFAKVTYTPTMVTTQSCSSKTREFSEFPEKTSVETTASRNVGSHERLQQGDIINIQDVKTKLILGTLDQSLLTMEIQLSLTTQDSTNMMNELIRKHLTVCNDA